MEEKLNAGVKRERKLRTRCAMKRELKPRHKKRFDGICLTLGD
jgi:hypothetical protein